MPDKVGQQIGHYRLVRLLGSGGFADVYLGQHVHLASKQAAVKMLKLFDVDVLKFWEEAETTEKLVHPRIIRLLDFDPRSEPPYLVLDFAPGGSLRARYPRGTQLPIATVVGYLKEITPALQYAHDLKILHRDIKPENILIGRGEELLLSDFGIAVLSQTGRTSLQNYTVGGTPYYMAPEQYQGKPEKASDQYSLAVVVYEWLCGTVPFREGNFIQLGFQHTYVPVPPMREKIPSIPSAVEEVVMTALGKDPHQRFGSVRAFANALEQAYAVPSQEVLQVEQPVPGQSIPTELSPVSSSGQTVEASEPPRQSVAEEIPPAVHDEHVEPVPSQPTPVEVPLNMAGQPPLQTPETKQPIAPTLPVTPVPPSSTGAVPVLTQPSAVSQTPSPAPIAPTQLASTSLRPGTPLPGLTTPVVSTARQESKNVPVWVAIGVIVAILVLLLLVGPILSQNNQASINAEATATANTADTTATAQADTTATAQANVVATLSVDNPNPYGGNGTLALYDPLSDNSRGYNWSTGTNNTGGDCEFTGGTYHASEQNTSYFLECNESFDFSNFTFEVQMQITKGDCGGIDFRDDSTTGKKYYFYVCQNGSYGLYRYVDFTGTNAMKLTAGQSSAINSRLNASNTIAVVANGSTLDLYVNKQKIASVTDSSYSHGTIALIVTPLSKPTEVAYSNAKAWKF